MKFYLMILIFDFRTILRAGNFLPGSGCAVCGPSGVESINMLHHFVGDLFNERGPGGSLAFLGQLGGSSPGGLDRVNYWPACFGGGKEGCVVVGYFTHRFLPHDFYLFFDFLKLFHPTIGIYQVSLW